VDGDREWRGREPQDDDAIAHASRPVGLSERSRHSVVIPPTVTGA